MIDDSQNSLSSNPDRQLIAQLELVSKDLFWSSEAEYPLDVFYWNKSDNFDEHTLLKLRNYPAETKIAIREFHSFLDSATRSEPWHNEAEQLEVRRYQAIANLIAENLTDVRVYLLGEVEIDVYILGKTRHQAIAGLTTKMVRT